MVVCVVDNAELSWCDTMNLFFGVYDKFARTRPLQSSRMILWCMSDLECHLTKGQTLCEEMEVMHRKVLLIGCRRVVAMRNVKNIPSDVLLHDEPRTASETHALALSDGVEPQSFMASDTLASLQLNDITRLFS